MNFMVIGKMVLVNMFQILRKRVIFVLTIMDRGEGSDIISCVANWTEWRW